MPSVKLPEAEAGDPVLTAYWQVEGRGRAWLDMQNDVTVKDVQQAAAENFASVEHMKRYTTQGMTTDQGKNSNVAALAILADATGRTIPADRHHHLPPALYAGSDRRDRRRRRRAPASRRNASPPRIRWRWNAARR